MLAPEALVQRVDKDLQAIRAKYPAVADVHHTAKWVPGMILLNDASKEKLDLISKSTYGPSEAHAIFQDTIYTVTFSKPYNPIKLAEILKNEFGIDKVEPNGMIGSSSSIILSSEPSGKNTYVFTKGWGDCIAGCINKHYWKFTIGPENSVVELVEENGDIESKNDSQVF